MCDGHGLYGHKVSNFIKEKLPTIIKQKLIEAKSRGKTFIDALTPADYSDILLKAFSECDQRLNSQDEDYDTRLSGSTVCTVIFDGTRIHCGNCGDSRAIKVKIINEGREQIVETN